MKSFIKRSGNTLIEVLIAVVIVGVVLTGAAYGLTVSVQNSAEAEYRQIATRYAQDVMEIFRKDKLSRSWGVFSSSPADNTISPPGNSAEAYCIPSNFTGIVDGNGNNLITTQRSLSTIGSCTPFVSSNPPMTFYRAVTKTQFTESSTGAPGVKIVVHVYWNVGVAGRERSVSLQQAFFRTEQ